MPLDIEHLRSDFPTLKRIVNGRPLNYLDSGATSHKPVQVLDAEREFYEQHNAAVHRGAHTLASEATEAFEAARDRMAEFLGAKSHEIVWAGNATAALNLVAYSFSNASIGATRRGTERFRLAPGDEIVVTELEHHANLIPWQELASRTGATLRYIGIDDDGRLRMNEARDIIGARTKVLAFAHVSNVLGGINPVAELVALAKEVGAFTVLDACQSAPHLSLNVAALDVDFAVLSGHKMLGPLGIGVLYGRGELLDAMPPFLTGGSMITSVTMERAEFLPSPARFEAGTQPVAQAVGLAAAADYLDGLGMAAVHERDAELGQALASGLASLPGIRILGPAPGEARVGLVSFVVDGVHSHDVGQFLDEHGIAVRIGHHCTAPLHSRLGVSSSTRASTGVYTTDSEVQDFLSAVAQVRSFFRA